MERTSWTLVRDGLGFRRAVPSPEPRRIREINAIKLLVRSGIIVICAGGGGIPVVRTPAGGLRGVEAVIDKDVSAALLAEQIGAEILLLLTDVPAVWTRWPKSQGEPIGRITPEALRRMSFTPGSMGPKVEAACRFVERTGRVAAIGAIENAETLLNGTGGTIVHPASLAISTAAQSFMLDGFIQDMKTRPVWREQTTLPHVIAINGGVPIKVGNDVIGGVGLSGSPGKDEECVNAGLEKVKQQLQ